MTAQVAQRGVDICALGCVQTHRGPDLFAVTEPALSWNGSSSLLMLRSLAGKRRPTRIVRQGDWDSVK